MDQQPRPNLHTEQITTNSLKTLDIFRSAVVLRDMGQFAGWAGLWVPWFLPEILPAVEVGGPLGETFRSRRYATEAGRA